MATPPPEGIPGLPKSRSDLTFGDKLGYGCMGNVYKATAQIPGKGTMTFAVKQVEVSKIKQRRLQEKIDREIQIGKRLRHPHVVTLYFDIRDDEYVTMGMEFAAGGTLWKKLTELGRFSPERASRYLRETCEALHYMHGLGDEQVIHRDIKPENLLLDAEDHIKLCDFGHSALKARGEMKQTFGGTCEYMCPEMIRGHQHDDKVDSWAAGVLNYELCTGISPFATSSQEATMKRILLVQYTTPDDVDKDAKDLISKLLVREPSERLDMGQVLQHTFVTKFHQGAADTTSSAAAADEEGSSKQSVIERRIRSEQDNFDSQMQTILLGKKKIEEQLGKARQELQATNRAFEKKKKEWEQKKADLQKQQARTEEQKTALKTLEQQEAELLQQLDQLKHPATPTKAGFFGFLKRQSEASTPSSASPSPAAVRDKGLLSPGGYAGRSP
eukprot:TRINITY_DN15032_c0_g1_i1.p1 TRINITY_DN15032_c0_g1~~TRINITY_DN15032_c0_g1_i1.p1  ORF type:complete len:443 (-),score=131.45 TRINITY_DN15032_c0_g1_i1:237-1565(-)